MPGSDPLTLDEIDQLAQDSNSLRDQAIILLICGCGPRANELRQVRICHVMRGDRTMTGTLHIPRAHAKGKRQARTIQIPQRAMQALLKWLAVHPAPHLNAWLFPSRENPDLPVTTRTIQRAFAAARTNLDRGRKLTPHSGRKFFGCAIYAGTGHDIAMTARALGQRNPTSTMHYLDLDGQRLTTATLAVFDKRTTPNLEGVPTE